VVSILEKSPYRRHRGIQKPEIRVTHIDIYVYLYRDALDSADPLDIRMLNVGRTSMVSVSESESGLTVLTAGPALLAGGRQ
jgi:hypothetical protein